MQKQREQMIEMRQRNKKDKAESLQPEKQKGSDPNESKSRPKH